MMNAVDQMSPSPISLYGAERDHEPGYETASDSKIWTAFKAGDQTAFEWMFKKNYEVLFNYGLKFNYNEDDVKDHIQQLFSKLWESRGRLGHNDSIKSYLLASLRRMIHRSSKAKYTMFTIQNLVPAFHMHLSVENRFFKDQKDKELMKCVAVLVEKLPKRQKEAVFLKYYGDRQYSEIAEIMGISIRVAYKLIYKALDNLGKQIPRKQLVLEELLGDS